MQVHTTEHNCLTLPVPFELSEDFDDVDHVNWRDDGQGVFTIIVVKKGL